MPKVGYNLEQDAWAPSPPYNPIHSCDSISSTRMNANMAAHASPKT